MRRSLILVFALLAGVATFVLLQVARAPAPGAEQVQPVNDAVYVLVYASDLPRGTLVDETGVMWQQQLRAALPAAAILADSADADLPDNVEGRLLRRDVLTGEVVRPEVLVDSAASFMSLTLAPGMRAVGIAVTPQKLAGGFILPDDRIDLIHTVTGDFDGDGKASSYSQTILENIRVLAVGETPTGRITFQTVDEQEAAASQQSDVTMKGETITLEMSDEAAAVLFSAQASGQISLALRALEDRGPARIVSTVGFEKAAEEAAPEPESEPAPEPAPAAVVQNPPASAPAVTRTPTTLTVRVIEGGTASFVDVPVTGAEGQP